MSKQIESMRSGLTAIKSLLSRDPCIHANTAIQMIDAMLAEQPAREPLTDEQRRETINRAWNDYLRGECDDSFGWYLSHAIEAAHGITGEQK